MSAASRRYPHLLGVDDPPCLVGLKTSFGSLTIAQLRCDVVQDPFTVCSRCTRLHLTCKIEDNFKRVGKRTRNAEMEREIADLKRRLGQQTHNPQASSSSIADKGISLPGGYANNMSADQWNGSRDAVAGLLDLRSGLDSSSGYMRSPNDRASTSKRLEDIVVPNDRVVELFNRCAVAVLRRILID